MAWSDIIDFIPIAGTIKHALADPKGRAITDYAPDATTQQECMTIPSAGILRCQRDINSRMIGYIMSWIGVPLASDMFKGVVVFTLNKFSEAIVKALSKKIGAKAAGAIVPGAGAVLAIDAVVDLGIIITKAWQIYKAAQSAKAVYCVCPPANTGAGGGTGTGTGGGSNTEEE